MKKFTFLILACFSFGVLSADGAFDLKKEELTPTNNYKYQVAKKVYDDLVNAKGDSRLKIPEFTMSSKKRYVAWMDGNKAQVGIEEAAYDICVAFGSDSLNAMAALLGHEIIHYYEKHNWGNSFASAYANLDVAGSVKTNAKSKDVKAIHETEADYLGGFLAYSAGYQTFGIMPQFLLEVYENYGLQSNIPGYPSLEDRAKLAVEAELRLEELISVYDAANYMIVLEEYEDVDAYFGYILKEYQSREIFNNAGVNMVTAALSMLPEDDPRAKFDYPIQLDGETRMTVKARGNALGFGASEEQMFNDYLNQAKKYFQQARALDENYATAFVNIACVTDIMGESEDAEYFASKAAKVARKTGDYKSEGDAYIIRGIAAINSGDESAGSDYLSRAKSKSPICAALATTNLYILSNGSRPMYDNPKEKLSLSTEKIDDFNLSGFMDNPDAETLLELNNEMQLGIKNLESSKILLHLYNGGERFVLMQLTNPGYEQPTGAGIYVGSTTRNLEDTYGPASYIQQARGGQFFVYKAKKIIFYVRDNEVRAWCVYRK